VLATHLTEVVRTHAHELIGRQEGHNLLENFRKSHPKVVDELVPNHMTLGAVVKVLQNLLKEQVSIRDLLTVFETLGDEAPNTKDIDVLTEAVRRRLARSITRKYTDDQGRVSVISLSPHYEELISNSLLQTETGVQLVMDPRQANEMINEIARVIDAHPEFAGQPVLLTSPTIRRHVRKLTERFIPQLMVISHNELTSDASVSSIGTVEMRYAG
ncbi:MAG: FHIPEP family type III secretion protein, partial [Bdellovibrionales bacterium]|nr:FHIPEP family type III secretion protein [Bdellovibrionales bacterium]